MFEKWRINRLLKEGIEEVPPGVWTLRPDQKGQMAGLVAKTVKSFPGDLARGSAVRKAIYSLLFSHHYFDEIDPKMSTAFLCAATALGEKHGEMLFVSGIDKMFEENPPRAVAATTAD